MLSRVAIKIITRITHATATGHRLPKLKKLHYYICNDSNSKIRGINLDIAMKRVDACYRHRRAKNNGIDSAPPQQSIITTTSPEFHIPFVTIF